MLRALPAVLSPALGGNRPVSPRGRCMLLSDPHPAATRPRHPTSTRQQHSAKRRTYPEQQRLYLDEQQPRAAAAPPPRQQSSPLITPARSHPSAGCCALLLATPPPLRGAARLPRLLLRRPARRHLQFGSERRAASLLLCGVRQVPLGHHLRRRVGVLLLLPPPHVEPRPRDPQAGRRRARHALLRAHGRVA